MALQPLNVFLFFMLCAFLGFNGYSFWNARSGVRLEVSTKNFDEIYNKPNSGSSGSKKNASSANNNVVRVSDATRSSLELHTLATKTTTATTASATPPSSSSQADLETAQVFEKLNLRVEESERKAHMAQENAKQLYTKIAGLEKKLAKSPMPPPQPTLPTCTPPTSEWCSVTMPAVSHFKFDPPTDPYRWRVAQIKAKNGDQVLLQQLLKYFPTPFNFLDGDTQFRTQQRLGDIFADDHFRDLEPLVTGDWKKGKMADKFPEWDKKKVMRSSTPQLMDYRKADRAPVVFLGYSLFEKRHDSFHEGEFVGFVSHGVNKILGQWDQVKDRTFKSPKVAFFHGYMNENWGLLSGYFANRTGDWGSIAQNSVMGIKAMLDDERVLMLLVNGHTNLTHPKLIVRPLGIPPQNHRQTWDAMRAGVKSPKKDLFFAGISNAISRNSLLNCVAKRFDLSKGELSVNKYCVDKGKKGEKCDPRLTIDEFYARIMNSRVIFTPPGLGYDTYRAWQSLTLGSMVVIEKGVGFDKTLYRLPALLVEDWSYVTPALLRSAYVEAVYRAEEFEFKKLTNSWWHGFVMNVSTTQSASTVYDTFPPSAQDVSFARPAVRYDCGADMSRCGPGTKRPPKTYC